MRTMSFWRPSMMALCMLVLGAGFAQVTTPFNQPLNPGDFVGWDNTVTGDPLMIKHEANQPIDGYTNNMHRLRLLPDAAYTIGTFASQVKDGALLLSPNITNFYLVGGPGPFSTVHLHDGGTHLAQDCYRPQMRNGMTITGNRDHMYMGQLHYSVGRTDAAIVWSDLPGSSPNDRLTLNFTSGYNALASSGSTSLLGLQTMVIQPTDAGDEAFVGIGDFDAAGATPTQRLDVHDGNVRFRDLPVGPPADELEKFVVVDDDGVLYHRPLPAIPADNCEWTMNPTAPNHVSTAFGTADPDCPDNADAVGIGLDLGSVTPDGKVEVRNENAYRRGINVISTAVADSSWGIHVNAHSGIQGCFGLRANAIGGALRSWGVYGTSNGSGKFARGGAFVSLGTPDEAHGVSGLVSGGIDDAYGVNGLSRADAKRNYGVYGKAEILNAASTRTFYGVYGTVDGNGPAATKWAGYFRGNLNVTGSGYVNNGILITSDASLKTDVEDVSGAMDLIGSLHPKTYFFLPQSHPHMQLSDSRQWGFLAQEVQEQFPELVETVHVPSVVDSAGIEIAPEMEHLSLNYNAFIPMLVAAVQEQQATIAQQQSALDEVNERLANMEQALAACCAAGAPTAPNDVFDGHGEKALDPALERLLLIAPNPFTDQTTVYYTLERHGRAQLLVNSADGRHIQVLHEGTLPAGEHRYDWSTAHLAPGVHYVTLLLDGEPIVKRAVKVR